MKKYKNCLVIGKFMPPHKGHEFLIRFAQQYADNVHVVVDCIQGQEIDTSLRKIWLEDAIAHINVYALPNFMPQDPSETKDFWSIWKNCLLEALDGVKPDAIVASMDYGYKLADVLGCDIVPVDISRDSLSISATMIKKDIYQYWDYLLDPVKSHFVKKLCIVGPESTGKSFLGQALAKELNTICVPEYAKEIIERQNGEFFIHNVKDFVDGQINTEKALSRFANKILLCDSSAMTTQLFAQLCFHQPFEFIDEVIAHHQYDHYLLCSPDMPFIPAKHREVIEGTEEVRISMFNSFKNILEKNNFNYTIVDGDFSNRKSIALAIAHDLLKKNPYPVK